ncbi:SMP-30/gluconolactonase/LRE family protein [Nocardia sp. NPDC023852]|uniref:SMP-30/gluconolactonase/LRE family protein n=1 Tax=Nocardia sp. NPDC023852 TaxID=3154697 RepID=UPI0033FFAC48
MCVMGMVGSGVPAAAESITEMAVRSPTIMRQSVSAPGYQDQQVVEPNSLPATNGLALDAQGRLFVAQAFFNRVTRVDLASRQLTRIADDTDPTTDQTHTPDDLTIGPDGNLYFTSVFTKSVVRMPLDGGNHTTVGTAITDGATGPNGIAFRGDRLYVSDLQFAPGSTGSLWAVDPAGVVPAIPVVRGLEVPEGFAFASDGLAYVPEMYARRIAVANVDTGQVTRLGVSFDTPVTAVKVVPPQIDPAEPLIVLEAGSGKVWKVSRSATAPSDKTLIGQGEPGLDNVVIAGDGTMYVSNFVRGDVRRVDVSTRELVPVLRAGPLSAPVSLNSTGDGGFVAGDMVSVVSIHSNGQVERLSRFALDSVQTITPSAVRIGQDVYLTDWLTTGKITRLNLDTGSRATVAQGFVAPWHVRQGPIGMLLVADQGLGSVLSVRIDGGSSVPVPIMEGFRSVGGLAFDASKGVVYASDSDSGTVLSAPVSGGAPTIVATGLAIPEGVAVDQDGSLLVAEAGAGRITRINPTSGARSTVASGFQMNVRGITTLPFLNYTADVAIPVPGTIVLSNPADGSVTKLVAR